MTVSSARRLVARALSATVYRRLELMGCPLGAEAVGEPGLHVEYGFASPNDLTALEALRPGLAAAARERFDHGERCFVGRCDGRVVMARWVARGLARIEFLRLALPLAADEAYGFDTWTSPDVRRLGVASEGGARLRAALASEGVATMIRAVWAWNPEAMRNAAREGFTPVGYAVRIGVSRLAWSRVRRTPRSAPTVP